MSLGLLTSSWPRPVADGIERARNWHLRRLTGWFTRAGAEPRLSLIICAGAGARDALLDACVEANIDVVPAPVSANRPIAPALLAHRGDHFNSTLFCMERLKVAPDAVFETLNGMRGQLRRMATWVGLMVEDVETLDRLVRLAPGLMMSVQHTALVLGEAPPQGALSPTAWAALRRRGQTAALAYAAAAASDLPDYDDLSRLIRAGYGDVLATSGAERRAAYDLWKTPTAPVGAAGPLGVDIALRHGAQHGLSERASLTARIAVGLAPMPMDGEGTDRLQAALRWAERCAESGDFDGCMRALVEAEPPPEGPMPELAVEALEKRITLLTFAGDRAGARAALDRLDDQVARLASPGYFARALIARARFVEALDPARARVDLLEAERLLRVHGYPDAAAAIAEGL